MPLVRVPRCADWRQGLYNMPLRFHVQAANLSGYSTTLFRALTDARRYALAYFSKGMGGGAVPPGSSRH